MRERERRRKGRRRERGRERGAEMEQKKRVRNLRLISLRKK